MPFDFLSVGFILFGVGNESSSLRGGAWLGLIRFLMKVNFRNGRKFEADVCL